MAQATKERSPRLDVKSQIALALQLLRSLATAKGLKQHISRPLYGNAYALMLKSVLTSALGFCFWTLAARMYDPESVGLASAAVSATSLIATIANLGLGLGIIRFLPTSSGHAREELVSSCFWLTGAAALLCSGVYVTGLRVWAPALAFLRGGPMLTASFSAFAVLAAWGSLADQVFVAQRSASYALVRTTLGSLTKLLILSMGLRWKAFGLYACFGSAYATGAALSLWFLPRAGENPVRLRYSRPWPPVDVLRYSISIYAAGFLQGAAPLVLPVMIANVLGGEFTAYFYICWSMASLLSVVPASLGTSFMAEGSYHPDKIRENALRSVLLSTALLASGAAGLAALGRLFLRAFGEGYAEHGYPVVCILAAASLPNALISPYLSALRIKKDSRGLALLSALSFGSSMLFCYLGMLRFGLTGVAAGWLLAQCIVAAAVAWKCRGLLKR